MGVKLAKVAVTLGLLPTAEESLRLTAAEGTDSKEWDW
jgi:phage terminase small subunit